jgi:hypothetical protein
MRRDGPEHGFDLPDAASAIACGMLARRADCTGGRRVTQTKVREDFGQGRVFGAREAVARGMADRIGTLDDVLAGLASRVPARSRRRSALAFD